MKLLDDKILDPDALLEHCPLDYGRHSPVPVTSLGTRDVLPTELRCQIIGDVDMKSLLTFRAVNQKAVATVDNMTEFKKVQCYH